MITVALDWSEQGANFGATVARTKGCVRHRPVRLYP